jgi:hypothetical protein
MNSSSIPWNILSSSAQVGIETDGWNLAEISENPDDVRDFTVHIAFVSPFSLPPVVHLGLTGIDADQRDTTRISLKSGLITESGFEAIISTWSNTRIYGVDFNWLAIGA